MDPVGVARSVIRSRGAACGLVVGRCIAAERAPKDPPKTDDVAMSDRRVSRDVRFAHNDNGCHLRCCA